MNRTFQFTGLDSGSFYPFVVYTTIATIISAVFMVVPWVIAPQRVDLDKASAYECGFDAFGEVRGRCFWSGAKGGGVGRVG